MSDLRCNDCGIERSYADANIADMYRTCGASERSMYQTDGKKDGHKHDWEEL